MTKTLRILCIGEAMIELRPDGDTYQSSVAGDTYNTAVYMKRLLGERAQISYFTALGDDPASATIMNACKAEALDTDNISIIAGGKPGLYMIHLTGDGERSFSYWRDNAAARNMMQASQLPDFGGFDLIYLSGITLAILPKDDRNRLINLCAQSSAKLCIDPNYRARLWPDRATASAAIKSAYDAADYILTGCEDEAALGGFADQEKIIAELSKYSNKEVVLKCGEKGCLLINPSAQTQVTATAPKNIIDTTAAGDSFNAAYLAARSYGRTPETAAQLANNLAARIIQHSGAIAPPSATQSFRLKV